MILFLSHRGHKRGSGGGKNQGKDESLKWVKVKLTVKTTEVYVYMEIKQACKWGQTNPQILRRIIS
jgi:hypothetical protein